MIDLPKGNYIEWNVKSVIKLNERDTYAYRVVLNYQDGTNTIQQKSGFKRKKKRKQPDYRQSGSCPMALIL